MKVAAARAAEHGRPHTQRWHVGDTPADISAAEYGGARALGVCTGIFKEARRFLAAAPVLLCAAAGATDCNGLQRAAASAPSPPRALCQAELMAVSDGSAVVLPDLADTAAVLTLLGL